MKVLSWLCLALVSLPLPSVSNDPTSADRSAGESVPVVTFLQEVTGRPGSPESKTYQQKVVLSADRVWVLDERRNLIQILRGDLDPAVLWEVSSDLARYREVTDLSRIQKDRRTQELQFMRRVADLPQDEKREMLKGAHIRLNDQGEPIREIELEELAPFPLAASLPAFLLHHHCHYHPPPLLVQHHCLILHQKHILLLLVLHLNLL